MRSNPLNTPSIQWSSDLSLLFKRTLPKYLADLKSVGIDQLKDLLWILPLKMGEIPRVTEFRFASPDANFRGLGKIASIQKRPMGRGGKRTFLNTLTVHVTDLKGEGVLELKWFNAYPNLIKKLEETDILLFWGQVQLYQGKKQIVNPIIESLQNIEQADQYQGEGVLIQYPTINKIKPQVLKELFDRIPNSLWSEIADPIDETILKRRQLPSLQDAFLTLHGKKGIPNESQIENARRRLAYQEFLEEQAKVFIRRQLFDDLPAPKLSVDDCELNSILSHFSFVFTQDQKRTLDDIRADLAGGRPMMRLVQGDVGCGKTAIAVASAQIVISHKKQVALMCPTEALALQHFLSISEDLKQTGIRTALLVGSLKKKDKANILQALALGEIDFLIGTHALIQESVTIPNLGLAIIDEQHKFGVEQRLKLLRDHPGCHCLIMTATPIPRSLSLTQYGDLDISIIKVMPKGRKGIKTRLVEPDNFNQFLNFLQTRLSLGEQAYIVTPSIEESEMIDLQNLEHVYERFKKLFPETKIEILHGKMKPDQKETIVKAFLAQKIQLLISTSVIEVGINVPSATVMAIMNPERFGLSSLHQLRGRIGRGDKPGFCFLVVDRQLPPPSLQRLRIVEGSTDGFYLAEEDLRLRGEGDLFGKDQSGSTGKRKIANIISDADLLMQAREDLQGILKQNPRFIETLNQALIESPIVTKTI
jgi:ATP-dependent DNA helicase RecG